MEFFCTAMQKMGIKKEITFRVHYLVVEKKNVVFRLWGKCTWGDSVVYQRETRVNKFSYKMILQFKLIKRWLMIDLKIGKEIIHVSLCWYMGICIFRNYFSNFLSNRFEGLGIHFFNLTVENFKVEISIFNSWIENWYVIYGLNEITIR